MLPVHEKILRIPSTSSILTHTAIFFLTQNVQSWHDKRKKEVKSAKFVACVICFYPAELDTAPPMPWAHV